MKFKVEDGGIDGVYLTYAEGFYFDTFEELIEFVNGVEELYRKKKGKVVVK